MSALLVDPQSDSLIGEATMKFFGKFIPVRRVAQSLRLPDGTHPQATETYAQSSGVWTRGRKIFGIRLVTSNNSNTPLEQGKPYFIEGQITGSTFLKVPKFTWVAGDERVSNIGLHYSEWERVRVSGLGVIVNLSSHEITSTTKESFTKITVEHVMPGGTFRVRCLFGPSFCVIPDDITLFIGSRIYYKGVLDGTGRTSKRMIIEVAEATVSFASILVTDSESSSSELNNDF